MSEPRALTHEYRLTRMQISFAIAQQYVRRFWWMLIGGPTFGAACLIVATDNTTRVCGLICLLWPLTIPARSFFVTSKPSQQLMKPTTLLADDEAFYLRASDGTGMKMPQSTLRSLTAQKGLYILETKRLAVALVPFEAFLTDQDRDTFEAMAIGAHEPQTAG